MTWEIDFSDYVSVLDEANQRIDSGDTNGVYDLVTGAVMGAGGYDKLPQNLKDQHDAVMSRLDGTCVPHTEMTNTY